MNKLKKQYITVSLEIFYYKRKHFSQADKCAFLHNRLETDCRLPMALLAGKFECHVFD